MYSIGIDEAGRGALAGPVVVAAVAIPRSFKPHHRSLPKLKDSKALSPIQRDAWYGHLMGHPLVYVSTARVYPSRIDGINIACAANLAASRAYERLARKLDLKEGSLEVLLDGSLYLGDPGHAGVESKTIIRGDQYRVCIKLASVVAKVTRDRYMVRLHQRYPKYNLRSHKGYGTQEHFRALKRHGISDIHRLTYLEGYPNLKPTKS
ncbi:MAG: ribonuclease HII [Patescibacteria group bacterium]|nr:ribonuclease HII [Patescibacteria group bacterium]